MVRAQAATVQKRIPIKLTPIKVSALDTKYIAQEPTWAEDVVFEEPGPKSRVTYNGELTRGLNWLNYACSGSEFRGFIEDYIKLKRPDTIKEDMLLLKKVSDKHINGSVARMARMAVQGFPFNEVHTAKIWQAVIEAAESSKGQKVIDDAAQAAKEAAKANKAPQPTIQERILAQVREYLGEVIDAGIDEIVLTGDTKIRPNLASRGFGEPHFKKIIELVTPEFNEFKEALLVKQDKSLKDDNSEQIREGYSHLSIKHMKTLIAYLDEVCSNAQRLIIEKKAGRVRKKKPVDKYKVVSKFKHIVEFPELKLKGIGPVECLGVTDVWVYNSKTKKLGVYRGQYSGCVSIKGNSWVGHSENTSVQKTLRKPDKQLAEFQTLGKNQLKKWFESIKSVEHRLNGRGNEYTLILRTV